MSEVLNTSNLFYVQPHWRNVHFCIRTTYTHDVFPIIQMNSSQTPFISAVESLENRSVAMLSRALAYVMLFQLKYSETVRQAQTSH